MKVSRATIIAISFRLNKLADQRPKPNRTEPNRAEYKLSRTESNRIALFLFVSISGGFHSFRTKQFIVALILYRFREFHTERMIVQ